MSGGLGGDGGAGGGTQQGGNGSGEWYGALGEMGNAAALHVFKGEELVPMPKALAKSFIETKAMVGADKIMRPQESWTPAQLDEWHEQLGMPKTAKDYKLSDVTPILEKTKGPDGKPIQIDEGMRDYMLGLAREARLTNAQFDRIFKGYVERQVTDYQRYQQEDAAALESWTAEQKQRLGTAYDATLDLANRTLAAAGAGPGSELLAKLKDLTFSDGVPLLRHPAFLDVFGAIGKKMHEGNLLPGEKVVQYGRTEDQLQREIAQFRSQHAAKMVGEGPEAKMLQKEYQVLSDELARIKGVTPTA